MDHLFEMRNNNCEFYDYGTRGAKVWVQNHIKGQMFVIFKNLHAASLRDIQQAICVHLCIVTLSEDASTILKFRAADSGLLVLGWTYDSHSEHFYVFRLDYYSIYFVIYCKNHMTKYF